MSRPIVWFAVLGCLVGALVGCSGSKPTETPAPPSNPPPGPSSPQPGPNPPSGQPKQPGGPPAPDLYETDPAKHVMPATPATGRLGGKAFTPDRVEFEGGQLTFRSGKEFFADQEVKIMLATAASDGLKLVVRPSQKWTDDIPTLHVSARKGKDFPDTKFVNDGYALTLELGKPDKGKIPGKVYLCLPDQERSYLAGTFTATRKRSLSEPPGDDEIPLIQGTVSPPLAKDHYIRVGYVGQTADKKAVGDMVSTKVFENGGGGVRSTSFAPRAATLRVEKFTPRFDYTNLPPGRYLVFARTDPGSAAWAWADVAAGGKHTIDLKLDGPKPGTVEVKMPADERTAQLAPSDLGAPPLAEDFLDRLGSLLGLEAEAKEGRAVIPGVPPGKYKVRAGNLRADVEVSSGKTTTVELKPAKK